MKKILQITHEGLHRGDYKEFTDLVMQYVEHYSEGILETFKLESNRFETSLFFEFYEAIDDDDADRLIEALQIELMDAYVVNFVELEIEL